MRHLIAATASTLFALNASADGMLHTFSALKPKIALEVAQATMEACRKEGYQVAVTVTDRFGIVQVMLRDQLAGPFNAHGECPTSAH